MNKETYEVLSALLSFHMAFEMANADKKIDVSDVQFLLAPMIKLPAAINGADKVLPELKSMDAAARGEMLAKLAAEYDIPNDAVEAKVEAGIEFLLSAGKFVGVIVAKS